MYYFVNLDKEDRSNEKISIIYQDDGLDQFPNGSVYSYDGNQTFPKLSYSVLPGGKINTQNKLEFNGNLKLLIDNNNLINNLIEEHFLF